MKKMAGNNFDLISFSSNFGLADPQFRINLAGLSLIGAMANHNIFDHGRKLVTLAEDANFSRQAGVLGAISERLLALSIPEFENIGDYYQAICLKREGRREEARALFENLAEKGSVSYRARAIQSIGKCYLEKGDHAYARKLFLEAEHLACQSEYSNPLTFFQSQLGFGVIQSTEGDHKSSLATFESLRPMIEIVAWKHPSLWFDYQNGLAVELMEVGRIEEAQHASRIALASPFARFYPEWHETARDIEAKTRRASSSFVSLINCDIPRKIISEPRPSRQIKKRPALVAVGDNVVSIESKIRPEPSSNQDQMSAEILAPNQDRTLAKILAFPERAKNTDDEEPLGGPEYVEKRYQIIITASDTRNLKLIDTLYEVLFREEFYDSENGPPYD